ncbi:unnamed protein product [Zymoseptoria tritici ST99CH_3D7]|uniref:Uncharacterized protein n=1 Tax=Zymoseptoria tritici (strain ST99CH_3D7) TaxID=1276538 RepID=A0A1X7S378_ZYMT9|nr:unnamed protein product [Zymoseptoria tritici ST99CH_3D7]
MNSFLIIIILLLSFIVLVLAWFAISSCLGDEVRAAWSGRRSANFPPTTYGLQYARHMGHSGALSEQIEMQDMLTEHDEMERF